MDSLVRMRYLFDTLQPDEQQDAIKLIATMCGSQWIMTLIFNHFAERLHSRSEDKHMIAAITKAISSVITDRKTEPKCDDIESPIDDESDTENEPISIEELPSVMISKVASYLTQNDYIHFMHSSRRILIGCNQPYSLCHLNVYDRDYSSLKTAMSLLNNCSVERLTIIRRRLWISGLSRFIGKNDYLQFISYSPNIKCIETPFKIPLTSKKPKIPTMLALKGTDYHFGDDVFSRFQRSLVRKHSKQIESLKLVSTPNHSRMTPTNHKLCNLTELHIGEMTGALTHRVLYKWITQSSKLKMLSIDCTKLTADFIFVIEFIMSLIKKQSDLEFTEFVYDAVCGVNVIKFMQRIGNGLDLSELKKAAKKDENKTFKVRIRLKGGWIDQKQKIETATNILMGILRDHDHLTIRDLDWKFYSSQSVLWKDAFENDLGDLQSFVQSHDRFRILGEDHRVALIGKGDGEELEAMSFERAMNAIHKTERLERAKEIIDGLGNLVEILEGCNIRHFMVQITVRLTGFMRTFRKQKAEGMEGGIDDLMQKWKEKYRVDTYYESKRKLLDDRWCITFCNKDNPMNGGYGAHGLFIE